MTETIIERARSHLSCAVAQISPQDDQIIMDHVRAAHELLSVIGKPHFHAAGTMAGKHIDECALCGRDLRDPIHKRGTA